jgi:hypothetical protein
VAELIEAGGLEIPPGITFLGGENGSGKEPTRAGARLDRPSSWPAARRGLTQASVARKGGIPSPGLTRRRDDAFV